MRDDPVVILAGTALLTAGILAAYPILLIPIGLAIGVWALLMAGRTAYHADLERKAEAEAIRARAYAQLEAGMDPAGVYGEYQPAVIDQHITAGQSNTPAT